MSAGPDSSYDSVDAHPQRAYLVDYLVGEADLKWPVVVDDNEKIKKLKKYRAVSIKGALNHKSLSDLRIL